MIADPADAPAHADIAVVGGGIAGLIAATRLARTGKRVIVVESGGRRQDADTHMLNAVEQVGEPYGGAAAGRFRALGGTSSRWGGALIPFAASDYEHPPGWDADWLGVGEDLLRWLPQAEALFGLPAGPYDDETAPPLAAADGAFVPRAAKWPPFAQRNVAHLLGAELAGASGPQVLLDTTVTGFEFHPDGRVAGLAARTGAGARTIAADQIVLAAGAIETTRLLLLLDRAADARLLAPHDVVGRYFADHLSAPRLRLETVDSPALNRVAGFRFEGQAMRNLRFEPDAALRATHALPAAFAHIAFESEGGGFAVLRALLRGIQQRRAPAAGTVAELARAAPWLVRAAWWRAAHKRLLFPADARFHVHVVVEQRPDRASRITLSDRIDAHGVPLPRIDWRIADEDRAALARTAALFAQGWAASPLAPLAQLVPAQSAGPGEGIYHPVGSARIGASARTGVVDRDLVVHGVPNLTLLSTAVFPTGGGANPTLMLVLAALRAAERLARKDRPWAS
jgi:choline dehydrogenase-like flavoprotein